MGILFDAVRIKAGKGITPAMIRTGSVIGAALAVESKIGQGAASIVALDEESTTITKEQYAYFHGRKLRPGIHMREEPARAVGRKEQSDHESQN